MDPKQKKLILIAGGVGIVAIALWPKSASAGTKKRGALVDTRRKQLLQAAVATTLEERKAAQDAIPLEDREAADTAQREADRVVPNDYDTAPPTQRQYDVVNGKNWYLTVNAQDGKGSWFAKNLNKTYAAEKYLIERGGNSMRVE